MFLQMLGGDKAGFASSGGVMLIAARASAGLPVIYLYHPEAQRLDLMLVCDKDEQDDLSEEQKKVLRKLAETAKAEARGRSQSPKRLVP